MVLLFSDESLYCLDFTDRRARVWRRRGERFQDANISEHDRYGGGSIMMWAGISRGGRTYLCIVMRGMVTGVRYMDDILDVYARRYAGTIGPQFVLMDDNARPHRARVVEEYLQQETTVRMDWPACSPDLDLIVPGWLRSTSNRRQSSVWTGQHDHLISTRSSMFGTCYTWRSCDVRSSQQLSWNWEMPSLKSGTIFGWQPSRDSL